MTATERHTLKTLIDQHRRQVVFKGVCLHCLEPIGYSTDPRKRYCSERCRKARYWLSRRDHVRRSARVGCRISSSAGAPESGLQQSLSRVGRTPLATESPGKISGAEGHHEGRKR